MTRTIATLALMLGLCAGEARAQGKVTAAREAAEWLMSQFGRKAGRSVPELAGRIEGISARYGEEAILAVRKGGPSACGLIEAAGADGPKAIRILSEYGELGATRILSRPEAMKSYLLYGDGAATALVRHPGVAEPLLAKAGEPAVKALAAVDPRNGRRLAMLMDGELANAGRQAEVLGVVGTHGDRAVNFLWQNKGTLAGGAALATFLANPEPFLDGTRNLAAAAGDAVVKPVVGGVMTVLIGVLILGGLLVVSVAALIHKHGLPHPEHVKTVSALFRK